VARKHEIQKGWALNNSTGRVMGDLGLRPEECRGYGAYLEGRVLALGVGRGRQDLTAEWKAIRRGNLINLVQPVA
jgi:hypothetical protein